MIVNDRRASTTTQLLLLADKGEEDEDIVRKGGERYIEANKSFDTAR